MIIKIILQHHSFKTRQNVFSDKHDSKNVLKTRQYASQRIIIIKKCIVIRNIRDDFEEFLLSCFGALLANDRPSGEDTSSTFFQLESVILLGDKKDKLLPWRVKKFN